MDIHNLSREFPEFREAIHKLKTEDAHFRKLFEKFETVDKAIVRAEERIDLLSSEQENSLRQERLAVKDELYAMLKNFSAPQS